MFHHLDLCLNHLSPCCEAKPQAKAPATPAPPEAPVPVTPTVVPPAEQRVEPPMLWLSPNGKGGGLRQGQRWDILIDGSLLQPRGF